MNHSPNHLGGTSMKNVLKLAFISATFISTSALAESDKLYGDVRYSLNNTDDGTDARFVAQNNNSRIGIKGNIAEEGGLTAFYQVEMGANVDSDADGDGDAVTQRFAAAGVKGDFGTIVYGRTSTAYKMAGLKLDPFYDTSAGAGFGGANYGLSPLTNGWADNTLAYSNKMGEISFNAAVFVDDSVEDSHDFNFGGSYETEEFMVGLQYVSVGETGVIPGVPTTESTAIRIYGKYNTGDFTVSASLEQIEPDGAGADTQTYAYVAGTYKLDENARLAASLGMVDKVSAAMNGTGITVGYFRNLLKNTEMNALVSVVDPDEDGGVEVTTISVGMSHKFSIGE